MSDGAFGFHVVGYVRGRSGARIGGNGGVWGRERVRLGTHHVVLSLGRAVEAQLISTLHPCE